MLEQIGTPGQEMISTPDSRVLRLRVHSERRTADPVHDEVGGGFGATRSRSPAPWPTEVG